MSVKSVLQYNLYNFGCVPLVASCRTSASHTNRTLYTIRLYASRSVLRQFSSLPPAPGRGRTNAYINLVLYVQRRGDFAEHGFNGFRHTSLMMLQTTVYTWYGRTLQLVLVLPVLLYCTTEQRLNPPLQRVYYRHTVEDIQPLLCLGLRLKQYVGLTVEALYFVKAESCTLYSVVLVYHDTTAVADTYIGRLVLHHFICAISYATIVIEYQYAGFTSVSESNALVHLKSRIYVWY